MASDEKSWNIHLRYIIFMLAAVIVVLVAVKWSQIPQLVEYITFALTLTSLVLAVLAIVYAFFSNSSLTQALGSLMHVSGQVSDSAQDLSEATQRLEKDLQMIPSRFATVEEKIEATHEMLAAQLDSTSQGVAETSDMFTEEFVAEFLRRSSLLGLLIMRFCYGAEKSGGAFTMEQVSEKIPVFTRDYFWAFSVALVSMGLLDYKKTDEIVSSMRINEKLAEGARKEFARRLDIVKKDTEKEHLKKQMEENLEIIESYFRNQN